MRLHHVGIVVKSLSEHGDACVRFLQLTPAGTIIYDPIQKVNLQFWQDASGRLIELIEPAGPDSPVQQALRKGGGLNHLCYEVDDLEIQVQLAVERGAIPVSAPMPAVAIEGRKVAFLFFPNMELVEFLEAPPAK